MTSLITTEQFAVVRRFKQVVSRYQRNRDLIAVGAYAPGHDPGPGRRHRALSAAGSLPAAERRRKVGYATAVAQLQFTLQTGESHAQLNFPWIR